MAVLVTIYAAFAAVNILGVERGTRLNSVLTVAKLLPLLLLLGAGLFAITPANLAIGEPPAPQTLARAASCCSSRSSGSRRRSCPARRVSCQL